MHAIPLPDDSERNYDDIAGPSMASRRGGRRVASTGAKEKKTPRTPKSKALKKEVPITYETSNLDDVQMEEDTSDICRQMDASNKAYIDEMRADRIELGYDPDEDFMARPMFKRMYAEEEKEIRETTKKIRKKWAVARNAKVFELKVKMSDMVKAQREAKKRAKLREKLEKEDAQFNEQQKEDFDLMDN